MPSDSQPRTGSSPGPPAQARTRLARAAVIEAARSLFLERGYGATTIEAISGLADVPPATLYRLFSSKHGILKALLDISIVGDEEAVPVKIIAQVNSRVAPLYRILESAAGSDSDAAALLDELTRQRQAGQRRIARSLALAGALRPELRERDAADVIHALMSPELYRLLVLDRHWKSERYERWLTSTLADQLLPGASAVRASGSSRDRIR
jgi:AcrR family transcriptional regulator